MHWLRAEVTLEDVVILQTNIQLSLSVSVKPRTWRLGVLS